MDNLSDLSAPKGALPAPQHAAKGFIRLLEVSVELAALHHNVPTIQHLSQLINSSLC